MTIWGWDHSVQGDWEQGNCLLPHVTIKHSSMYPYQILSVCWLLYVKLLPRLVVEPSCHVASSCWLEAPVAPVKLQTIASRSRNSSIPKLTTVWQQLTMMNTWSELLIQLLIYEFSIIFSGFQWLMYYKNSTWLTILLKHTAIPGNPSIIMAALRFHDQISMIGSYHFPTNQSCSWIPNMLAVHIRSWSAQHDWLNCRRPRRASFSQLCLAETSMADDAWWWWWWW